jgi:hypothetical protein
MALGISDGNTGLCFALERIMRVDQELQFPVIGLGQSRPQGFKARDSPRYEDDLVLSRGRTLFPEVGDSRSQGSPIL